MVLVCGEKPQKPNVGYKTLENPAPARETSMVNESSLLSLCEVTLAMLSSGQGPGLASRTILSQDLDLCEGLQEPCGSQTLEAQAPYGKCCSVLVDPTHMLRVPGITSSDF